METDADKGFEQIVDKNYRNWYGLRTLREYGLACFHLESGRYLELNA